MIRTIRESTPVARKRHRCEECNRRIWPGTRYLRQLNCDGSDNWTFKAHIDCGELGIKVRDKHHLWHDWMPLHEMLEWAEEFRGYFPHAVCRLEFGP